HVFTPAVRDIATLAVMVRDGLSEAPDEAWRLSASFADPEFRSLSAQADAVQKLASDMDNIARYPVLLESLFSDSQVARIQEDQRRSAGRAVAEVLARSNRRAPVGGTAGTVGVRGGARTAAGEVTASR